MLRYPPPPPTIRVGLMKHYFFCAFLSLLLSGCLGGGGGGGGGGSTSSSKKKDKAAKDCTTPIPNGKGGLLWNSTTKKYGTTCKVVSCNAGYDNDVDSTKCQQTASGFYSLAKDKTRKKCPTPTHSSSTGRSGLSSPNDCWNCKSGSLKNTRNKKCTLPTKGKYINASGNEQRCIDPGGTLGGFDEFLDNTRGVSSAHGCNFSCRSGYVKSVSNYTCTQGQTCPIASGVGFQQISSAPCQVVDCNSGFVKNTGADSCDIPDTGKYANNLGREQDCDDPTGDTGGFNTFLSNTGAVSAANGCDFSCNTGFVKDASGRACNYPSSGNYVNASGAEVACTDISGIPNFNSWESGAATDADSCPFLCASGYTISGRMCNKTIPEMLALGHDTSHILFSNGEVEAWGKVSTDRWRTHIKENLGSHTPQALVSGGYHQCIILENSGQNHGRLMCWGQNGDNQLGVGDTNPRTTPTPVGHTILGDTGDGATPKTVKSVAAGGDHTCALLNDDTVKCWGRNHKGQIGGGSGSYNTISGSAGDPLSGGIASRIATGGFHTCAVLSDNSVQCWGYNQLGANRRRNSEFGS